MEQLKTGQFYGITNETIHLAGVTLTDTAYTHDRVDWHYHENAYFTFLLEGAVLEGNKKEVYHCSPGSLLFHNWQEAHYNIKPNGFTRGFQVELKPSWFDAFDMNTDTIQGSLQLANPRLKMTMYNIFKETKLSKGNSLGIDTLLLSLFSQMKGEDARYSTKKPNWVQQLRQILQDAPFEDWSLPALAAMLDIHPVHLSREFSRHFHCNLGDYIRTVKVQRALSLLTNKQRSLTDIALACGFADQSHFIRSFKSLHTLTPLQFRKLLLK